MRPALALFGEEQDQPSPAHFRRPSRFRGLRTGIAGPLGQALVAMLYQMGDLSSKEACGTLDLSRRAFEDLLARFGVAVVPDDDESVAAELSA